MLAMMVLSLVAETWNPRDPTMAMLMPVVVSPIHTMMTLETFFETLYSSITNISIIYIYKIENIKYKVLYYSSKQAITQPTNMNPK
jgi:hypothetical protein